MYRYVPIPTLVYKKTILHEQFNNISDSFKHVVFTAPSCSDLLTFHSPFPLQLRKCCHIRLGN